MRLFSRHDVRLVLGLLLSVVFVFGRPLHWLSEAAHDAELRFHLDLLPGLVVLLLMLGYHEYRKRRPVLASVHPASPAANATDLPAATQAARPDELQQLVAFGRAVEAAQARARADELQRLVSFGRALGQAVEPAALKQVLWRYLPVFARDRAFWVLTQRDQHWDEHLQDFRIAGRSNEELERIAQEALGRTGTETDAPGILVNDNVCFALVVGDVPVGVLGVQNTPPISADERRALGAVVPIVAIAIRNVQLLVETREYSLRDRLTGCFSRAHGIDSLKQELLRARRTNHPLSLVMFDVDHFKSINDKYGHVVGDSMLEAVGKALGRVLRVSDLKCRYGGDEFFVVLPETPLSGAVQAAESLLREVSHLRVTSGDGVVGATISVGVVSAHLAEIDPEALIARADDALYQAKRAGRNRYVVAPTPSRAGQPLEWLAEHAGASAGAP
jgi:diguanylate cyclase (GGDEF)-like protein